MVHQHGSRGCGRIQKFTETLHNAMGLSILLCYEEPKSDELTLTLQHDHTYSIHYSSYMPSRHSFKIKFVQVMAAGVVLIQVP